MSTSADIRAAWLAAIWTHASITALTDKIYDYDITQESEAERAKLMYLQKVDFFTYIANRAPVGELLGCGSSGDQVQWQHRVQVNRYIEATPAGVEHNQTIDQIQLVESLAQTELTRNWSGTVDHRIDIVVNNPVLIELVERPVWRCQATYTAIDTTVYT